MFNIFNKLCLVSWAQSWNLFHEEQEVLPLCQTPTVWKGRRLNQLSRGHSQLNKRFCHYFNNNKTWLYEKLGFKLELELELCLTIFAILNGTKESWLQRKASYRSIVLLWIVAENKENYFIPDQCHNHRLFVYIFSLIFAKLSPSSSTSIKLNFFTFF